MVFSAVSALLAMAALYALPSLVAKPKMLFGRSLSAMEPALFPKIVLVFIIVLSIALAIPSLIKLFQTSGEAEAETESTTLKKAAFFFILVSYGLLLKPLGFLITSFIVLTVISLLLGNRNWIQIFLFSLLSPVCLYLLATRGMLVSLPELNPIELLYAKLLAPFGR